MDQNGTWNFCSHRNRLLECSYCLSLKDDLFYQTKFLHLSYSFISAWGGGQGGGGILVLLVTWGRAILGVPFSSCCRIMSIILKKLRHFMELWVSFSGDFHNFRHYGPDFHSICGIMALKVIENLRNYGYQSFG